MGRRHTLTAFPPSSGVKAVHITLAAFAKRGGVVPMLVTAFAKGLGIDSSGVEITVAIIGSLYKYR